VPTTTRARLLFAASFALAIGVLAPLGAHAAGGSSAPAIRAILPNGRLVTPVGALTTVGDFPLGAAVSPDGRLVVTTNDGQGYGLNDGFNSYCGQGQNGGHPAPCPYIANNPAQASHVGNPATPSADESLTVLDTLTGAARTVTAVPTTTDPSKLGQPGTFNFFYVGLAFSPDGQHLYAAGGGNNAIYDFPVSGDVVASQPAHTIVIPASFAGPTVGPLDPNYPVFGTVSGFTKGLAVTADGKYLLVAHEFNNTVDIVDTATGATNQVALDANPGPIGGFYPYGVAISHDGGTAWVTGQGLGEVAQVALTGGRGTVARMIPVGDHPTGVTLSPDGSQLFVTNANDDTLSMVSTATGTVVQKVVLHAVLGEQLGSTPNSVTVSPDGQVVYVTLAGDDAVAVLTQASGMWRLRGLIPTGWYPTAVATSPNGGALYIVSAKGLGSRPPRITTTYQYDGNNMPGLLQALPAPDPAGRTLVSWTAEVARDITFAAAGHGRSLNNPIPADPGGPTPIKHVIEIVRENRTFDQVLGDLGADEGRLRTGAAGVDGQPSFVTFGKDVTPNAHALLGDPTAGAAGPAFATSDRFYSDGEASIQGHWWTAAGNVTDYVEKAWPQYYSPRNHVNDPESTVTQPHNCSIFQAAVQRSTATRGQFSVRDYGELIGLQGLSIPGVNLGFAGPVDVPDPCMVIPNTSFDPKAVGDENLDVDNRTTAQEFLSDIGINPDGSATGSNGDFLRNFSYITLSGDHTGGLSFAETPRSRVAENDAGLGMIVQAISHSSYWKDTAIFVMEDDSQDGLDHVDGHRNVLYVISPWTKHAGPDGKPGYVSHIHYSQASVLATIEDLTGLPHLSTYDQSAAPLYDLFQDMNDPTQLTAADLQPFTAQPLPSFVPEQTACYTQNPPPAGCHPTVTNAGLRESLTTRSRLLDTSGIDKASPDLEIIDWQLAHPDLPVPQQLRGELAAWRANRSDND
jgi:DNA-binding beta-propeller fold protein YncE